MSTVRQDCSTCVIATVSSHVDVTLDLYFVPTSLNCSHNYFVAPYQAQVLRLVTIQVTRSMPAGEFYVPANIHGAVPTFLPAAFGAKMRATVERSHTVFVALDCTVKHFRMAFHNALERVSRYPGSCL